jgi:hypothetical protein
MAVTTGNGCLRRKRKEIVQCSLSNVYQTVRCAHGQKASKAFQTKEEMTLLVLGAIKGLL